MTAKPVEPTDEQVEVVARVLYAERRKVAGYPYPSDERISQVWRNNATAKIKWMKAARAAIAAWERVRT